MPRSEGPSRVPRRQPRDGPDTTNKAPWTPDGGPAGRPSGDSTTMRHIISILVENEFGALARIAGLFTARGYNIESLTVAPTDDPTLSRMTLVTVGNDSIIEQIIKQLNKLLDVVKVMDITEATHIEREMMLIKAHAVGNDAREEIKRLTDIFRGRILDATDRIYTIELTGASDKLDAFIGVLGQATILEVVRSGVIGIARGDKHLRI
jgi:acetolactate synthase I/III small subunit